MQGFNALQISILPITHDSSIGEANLEPFLKTNGEKENWDFTQYNPAYFEKAAKMVEMAVEKGFVPVLGVLWCSYVPGTRCSENSPIASAMPLDCIAPYARYVAKLFKAYEPIFFISGDTRFESEHEALYYMAALEAVKQVCPQALLTMHLHPEGDVPEDFCKHIDFYMYQSGHGAQGQDLAYKLAEKFRNYAIKRPVLNSEPCYEGHGRIGDNTRFDAFDIRKASWQSLLAGAKMGIAYGAHGIWSFHKEGLHFLNSHRSFEPYDWWDALALEGSWDMGYAKWLFERYQLLELEPSELLANNDPEICLAANPDLSKIAVYMPYPFSLKINYDLTGYELIGIDLTTRQIVLPEVYTGITSLIKMPRRNGDFLFIAHK